MSSHTLTETLEELDAGIFADKAYEALKQAALGAIMTGKKGNITITLELERIGDSNSVQVKHSLKYTKPTKNGKVIEENKTSTPMYVNKDGGLSISPELQADLFAADKTNKVTPFGDRTNG